MCLGPESLTIFFNEEAENLLATANKAFASLDSKSSISKVQEAFKARNAYFNYVHKDSFNVSLDKEWKLNATPEA